MVIMRCCQKVSVYVTSFYFSVQKSFYHSRRPWIHDTTARYLKKVFLTLTCSFFPSRARRLVNCFNNKISIYVFCWTSINCLMCPAHCWVNPVTDISCTVGLLIQNTISKEFYIQVCVLMLICIISNKTLTTTDNHEIMPNNSKIAES